MGFINLVAMRNYNIRPTFIIYRTYRTRSTLCNILYLLYYWILSNIRYRLLTTS